MLLDTCAKRGLDRLEGIVYRLYRMCTPVHLATLARAQGARARVPAWARGGAGVGWRCGGAAAGATGHATRQHDADTLPPLLLLLRRCCSCCHDPAPAPAPLGAGPHVYIDIASLCSPDSLCSRLARLGRLGASPSASGAMHIRRAAMAMGAAKRLPLPEMEMGWSSKTQRKTLAR
jgi:hypothetical protein